MVRFLYFLLLLFLVRLAWRALSEWMESSPPSSSSRVDSGTVYKGIMVRDPVCGRHLPESRALTEIRAGNKVHFCSDECRRAYREAS